MHGTRILYCQTLIAIALTLSVVPASAQESVPWIYQAGQLLNDCRSAETVARELDAGRGTFSREALDGFTRCSAYLDGFTDAHLLMAPQRGFCLPNGISPQQVRRVFVAYAERHPEVHHLHRSTVLDRALTDAFRC